MTPGPVGLDPLDEAAEPSLAGARVAVVGGGLAGLAAARRLVAAGLTVTVYEAGDAVGGRVRTDAVDGFLLDRGFQVLLTGYPTAARLLDLPSLDLRAFSPGALVWDGSRRQRLADPLRAPLTDTLQTVFATVATPLDKLRLARLRWRLTATSGTDLLRGPERSTRAELAAEGFSERFVDAFFRPFLGGVLLDPDLETTARAMRVILRAFFTGEAAVPSMGMGAIPQRLAAGLDVRLEQVVDHLEEIPKADAVVVATAAPSAAQLLGLSELDTGGKPAATFYFSTPRAPLREPVLVLDGTGVGPVTHVAVPSLAAPSYAPTGWHLVAANVTGPPAADVDVTLLEPDVRRQLSHMLTTDTTDWRLLRTYQIRHGQPVQRALANRPVRVRSGVYLAGDHTAAASIEGALRSGVRAANRVVEDLSVGAAAA